MAVFGRRRYSLYNSIPTATTASARLEDCALTILVLVQSLPCLRGDGDGLRRGTQ